MVSDPQAKAERSAAKDARQMPAPDSAVRKGRKKNRAGGWRVEIKYHSEWFPDWHKCCAGPEPDARRIYAREVRIAGSITKSVRLLDDSGVVVEEVGG